MKICKRGHLYKENNRQRCPICRAEQGIKWYVKNRQRRIEQNTKWQANNPEKSRIYISKYYMANKERRKIYAKMYYDKHKSYYAMRVRGRDKTIQNATPPWADIDAINKFYTECPEGYEIDHIIPLKHPLVTGLHVLSNLQYLPKKENRSKSNKFEPIFISS